MANQDFDINIRINANTAQVDAVRQSFEKLGAQVQVTNAQVAAGAGAGGIGGATASAQAIGRVIGQVGAVFGADAFINQIRQFAAETEKSTQQLDKQGSQLVKNAQARHEHAQAVKTESDALKVASTALAQYHGIQEQLTDTLGEQLPLHLKILDAMTVGPTLGAKPFQDALDARNKRAQSVADGYRDEARRALAEAEFYREQFDKRKNQPFEEALEKENERIKELVAEQKALERDALGNVKYPESYVNIGKQIQQHQNLIQDITQAHQQFNTPNTAVEQLHDQLRKFSDIGDRKDLTPREQAEARDRYIDTQKALRDAQIKAVEDKRAADAEALRKRYEGEGIPTAPKPGQTTGSFNADVLEVLRRLLGQWQ